MKFIESKMGYVNTSHVMQFEIATLSSGQAVSFFPASKRGDIDLCDGKYIIAEMINGRKILIYGPFIENDYMEYDINAEDALERLCDEINQHQYYINH